MELKMTLMGHKLSHCNSFSRETVGNVWRDLIIRTVGGFEDTIGIQRVKVRRATHPVMPMTSSQRILWPQMLIVVKVEKFSYKAL